MSENNKKEKNNIKKTSKLKLTILIIFWSVFFLTIGGIYLFFSKISQGEMGSLPKIEDLQNPENKFASEIYSADGVVLGRFFESKANRVETLYKDLSPYLINALIATEDSRYREHSGIDFESLKRVFVKTIILRQENAGGGSTISQQLAKLLFTKNPAENLTERAKQKITVEWVTAVKLEKLYSKDEIIQLYLNKFDFLNNAVGINSAAQVYFGKTPKVLNIEEAALLIGMLKNPASYNPAKQKNYDKCVNRRNVVLDQMLKANYLTKNQCDSLKKTPIVLNFTKVDHKLGLAPYFREFLRKTMNATQPVKANYRNWEMQQYVIDSIAWNNDPLYGWCNKNLKPDGSKYNLYTDGLKIYTTIDSRMQKNAEDAMREHIGGYLQNVFNKELKGKSKAPYTNQITAGRYDTLMRMAVKNTDRYRAMKRNGDSQSEIDKVFKTPVDMEVFIWKKENINGRDTVYASTIDTTLSPLDSIKHIKSFLQSGMLSMDPFNGHVKAYVGGIDFFHFQYDMATQGRRQVGSTIKPFLYALAMESGMTPCTEAPNTQPNVPLADGTIWSPKNSFAGEKQRQEIGEMITLKRGLQTSNNWISAYLIKQLQPANFVRLLKAFGIKSHLDCVYPLCLGVTDISVEEMVAGYTAFANRGIKTDPVYVTCIKDNNGNVVSNNMTARTNEMLKCETSYKMIEMMKAVMHGGTGSRIYSQTYKYSIPYTTEVAGKTGTTQSNSDGWFIGYVPKLVTGVWVGGDNRDIHFDNMNNGQGSASALPIWGYYMNKIYKDNDLNTLYKTSDRFEVPSHFNSCEGTEGSNSSDKTDSATDSNDLEMLD